MNPKNAKLHYNLGHVMCGEGRGGGGDKSPSTMTHCTALFREVGCTTEQPPALVADCVWFSAFEIRIDDLRWKRLRLDERHPGTEIRRWSREASWLVSRNILAGDTPGDENHPGW